LKSFENDRIVFDWMTPNVDFAQIKLTATAIDGDQTTINNFFVDLPNSN